ncbi:MAG: NAD-binding protein [Austwickia sp.]|nr:NAD-binding protein [Actinomycetota bacterium]MCB1251765.1 potassium channel protein [Austwickia sp.]MCO5308800.1 NAD-binding protein [Austwickia sp.]
MNSLRRITTAVGALLIVTVFGTIGYLMLGFTLIEALYQTVTTVATVGFREVRPLTTAGELFTITLIVLGVGTCLYNLTVLLEALTEGDLRDYLERRHMDKRIAAKSGHVIVCGYGRVGRAAVEQLRATGERMVIVDSDPAKLVGIGDVPYVVGDVTNDDILREAGIDRARALIAALETDADSVYVVLSARALRPDLVIVARARTADSKTKMVLAGADRAVNPQGIGGRRLASFALAPAATQFMDVVMHDEEFDYRIQQVDVRVGSLLAGRTVGSLELQRTIGCLLLAIRQPGARSFTATPHPEVVIEPGSVLIAFGTQEQLTRLSAAGGVPDAHPTRAS